MRLVVALATAGLVLAACGDSGDPGATPTSPQTEAPTPSGGGSGILALGDSIFEWNSIQGDSIPEVIGRELATPILNAARSGAHFSNSDSTAAEGLDIREQYQDEHWEWIVIIGGANDYRDDCGCGECESHIDALLSADGLRGEIPDFIQDVLTDDTRVMFVGYYEVPSDADFGFNLCVDEGMEHNARLALMAEAIDGVWFVSAGDVVSADNRTAYAQDRVHPSIAGSRLVGEYVAAAIKSVGTN